MFKSSGIISLLNMQFNKNSRLECHPIRKSFNFLVLAQKPKRLPISKSFCVTVTSTLFTQGTSASWNTRSPLGRIDRCSEGDQMLTPLGILISFCARTGTWFGLVQIVDVVLILDGDLVEVSKCCGQICWSWARSSRKSNRNSYKSHLRCCDRLVARLSIMREKATMPLQICCVKNRGIFSVNVGSNSSKLVSVNNWI